MSAGEDEKTPGSQPSDDKKQWKGVSVHLRSTAPTSADDKINAAIDIEPEHARTLIEGFRLLVNGRVEGTYEANSRYVSVSGFSVEKGEPIVITVVAIPITNNKPRKEKSSNALHFISEGVGRRPRIHVDVQPHETEPYVGIKWKHIGDRCAQKYVVCLDGKEIHHLDQRSAGEDIEVRLYDLPRKKAYAAEIIAELASREETYRSAEKKISAPKQSPEDAQRLPADDKKLQQHVAKLLKLLHNQIQARNTS